MSSLRVHQLNFEISFLFFQNSNKNLFDQLSTRFDLILEQGVPKVWRHFVIIVVFMITLAAPPAAHGAHLTSDKSSLDDWMLQLDQMSTNL